MPKASRTSNLALARVYINHTDSKPGPRTWLEVMGNIVAKKSGGKQRHWESAVWAKNFACIRGLGGDVGAEHFEENNLSCTPPLRCFQRRAARHWLTRYSILDRKHEWWLADRKHPRLQPHAMSGAMPPIPGNPLVPGAGCCRVELSPTRVNLSHGWWS